MPVALISTSTSPSRGPSRSTVAISSGFPAANATAARDFIRGTPEDFDESRLQTNAHEGKHNIHHAVIPGRAIFSREPGIHIPCRGYGFRARACRRVPE